MNGDQGGDKGAVSLSAAPGGSADTWQGSKAGLSQKDLKAFGRPNVWLRERGWSCEAFDPGDAGAALEAQVKQERRASWCSSL